MSLLAECPVCHAPLRWHYFLRSVFAQWRCEHCHSLLGINRLRRSVAGIFLITFCMLGYTWLSRWGFSPIASILPALVIWAPYFLVTDRARVIERCGFHCHGCGYNLHGQTVPRCPECGREFSPEERRMMESGIRPAAVPDKNEKLFFALITAVFILITALLLYGVYLTGIRSLTKTAAPSNPPTTSQAANGVVQPADVNP